jgi:GTP-binding protein
VRLFSAPKRIGIDEVAQVLWQWAHPAEAIPASSAVATE